MLEGFEVFGSGRARPFISLRKTSVTFSRLAVEQLDFSPYIRVLIDKKGKRVAFQVADENDEMAYRFFVKPKEGRSILIRITEKVLADALLNLTNVKLQGNVGYRFYGEFLEEEKAIIVDMTQEPEQNESQAARKGVKEQDRAGDEG